MTEIINPYSLSRRAFTRAVTAAGVVPLAVSAGELDYDNGNRHIMAEVANTLVNDPNFVLPHVYLRERYREAGEDVSKYGIWHTLQLLGFIQSSALRNSNPWIQPQHASQLSTDLARIDYRLLGSVTPDYDSNITMELAGLALTSLSTVAAHNLQKDYEEDMAKMPSQGQGINRRDLMKVFLVGIAYLPGATATLLNPLNYDMRNHREYHNLPPSILKQLFSPDQYTRLTDYYQRFLAIPPGSTSAELMTPEEYDTRKELQNEEYRSALSTASSIHEGHQILKELTNLQYSAYEAYKQRFFDITDRIGTYFGDIIHAPPESPLLTLQSNHNRDIADVGVGLQVLNLVNRPNPDILV